MDRALGLLITFVVICFALLAGLSGSSTSSTQASSGTKASSGSSATGGSHRHPTPASTTTTVPPAQVTVLVANGSAVTGAAAAVRNQLQELAWNVTGAVNASAVVPASEVLYQAGQQSQAKNIATDLKLPASTVAPLTSAAPVSGASSDDVVVIVGPELANSANNAG